MNPKELVNDEPWAMVESLLPLEPSKPNGGRLRCPNRAALEVIVYVLRSGILWGMLPKEAGYEGNATCHRHPVNSRLGRQ